MYIIPEEYTIVQAMGNLDIVRVKVLFVVREDKFCATLTDGDVRRAILRGVSLNAQVSEIANYNPLSFVAEDAASASVILKNRQISAAPIVDNEMKIIGICTAFDDAVELARQKINIPVVIMAGGLGTRLFPYTKILPKALVPVNDTPIVERIIQSFQDVGCQEFYMIVNYKKNMIKAYFNDIEKKYQLYFLEEDEPLGTGGGLCLVKDILDQTFIMSNCDIMILDDIKKIVEYHKEQKNIVTMICSLKNYQIPYGIVKFSEGGSIESLEEKPRMSFFTNTGCYILEPEVFQYIGKDEKIDMPDIIIRIKEQNEKVGIYPIGEDAWLDMGEMEALEKMEFELHNKKK